MNQSFDSNQSQQPAPTDNSMSQPASDPTQIPVQQMPQSSNMPIDNIQPNMAPPGQDTSFQPNAMAPVATAKSSLWLIITLVVILFIGVMILASWEGWINLGSISSLWKKNTATVTTTPTTTVSQATKNDNTRKTDLANLKAALKSYYQANQTYPISTTVQKTSDQSSVLSVLVPTYIAKLPVDPLSPASYYGYQSDGKTFKLTSALEDKTDTTGVVSGSYNIYTVTGTSVETPANTSATSGTTDTSSSQATPTTPTTTTNSSTDTTGTSTSSSSSTSGAASASATAGQ